MIRWFRILPLLLTSAVCVSLILPQFQASPVPDSSQVQSGPLPCPIAHPPCPPTLSSQALNIQERHAEANFDPPPAGAPAISATSALEIAWFEGRPDGSVAATQQAILAGWGGKQIWVVRYLGVCLHPGGPAGLDRSKCMPNRTWNVMIDATSGSFIAAFTDG